MSDSLDEKLKRHYANLVNLPVINSFGRENRAIDLTCICIRMVVRLAISRCRTPAASRCIFSSSMASSLKDVNSVLIVSKDCAKRTGFGAPACMYHEQDIHVFDTT